MSKIYISFFIFAFQNTFAANPTSIYIQPPDTKFIQEQSRQISLLKNTAYMNSIFPSIETAAKWVCKYKIKPQTITISTGLISVSWETEKLCPK